MNAEEFIRSLADDQPPKEISVLLQSLWYDAKGDWERSHHLISDIDTKDAALIHAYLHRKEGDMWNADYWYKRAVAKRPDMTIEKEWEELVVRFIA